MNSFGRKDISDALYEWLLRLLHQLGNWSRKDFSSILLLCRPDFRSHLTHGQRDAMLVAFVIGHKIDKIRGAIGVIAIPDVVEQALPWLKRTLSARYGVAKVMSVNKDRKMTV